MVSFVLLTHWSLHYMVVPGFTFAFIFCFIGSALLLLVTGFLRIYHSPCRRLLWSDRCGTVESRFNDVVAVSNKSIVRSNITFKRVRPEMTSIDSFILVLRKKKRQFLLPDERKKKKSSLNISYAQIGEAAFGILTDMLFFSEGLSRRGHERF